MGYRMVFTPDEKEIFSDQIRFIARNKFPELVVEVCRITNYGPSTVRSALGAAEGTEPRPVIVQEAYKLCCEHAGEKPDRLIDWVPSDYHGYMQVLKERGLAVGPPGGSAVFGSELALRRARLGE